jgi:hypothetical protein
LLRRSIPDERPDRPFTGFKLARAVLSADGRRAGFAGLSIGAHRVYGVAALASCVWNQRHEPPKRWCGCGFYCLSTLAEAQALSCATDNRVAVLLEVAASGRYIRYEHGLRYSRQRVRAIRVSACRCGRRACAFVDAGSGFVGWRRLTAACPACAAGRPCVTFGRFAAVLDRPVPIRADAGISADAGTMADLAGAGGTTPGLAGAGTMADLAGAGGMAPDLAGADGTPDSSSAAVLTAEIALMQARLDDLQTRVAHLYGGPADD